MKNIAMKVGVVVAVLVALSIFASSASAMKPGSQVGAEQDQVRGDPAEPGPVIDGGNEDSPGPGGDSAGDGVPDNEDPESHRDRDGW